MRILYTHRTQGVGAEGAHILGMFEAFAELGHDIRMDCLPGCDPSARAGNASVTATAPDAKPKPSPIQRIYWFIAENCPETVFELFELAYNLPLFLRLAYRYLRFRPELIYERYALNTFAPALLCRLTGCAHVLEVNDSVVIERSRPLALGRIAARCEAFCLGGARIAITITERFRDLLAARFPACAGRIMVLPNAISGRRFAKAFDRHAMRARLGVEGKIVVGASGQFLPWHGLSELIERIGPEAAAMDLFFLFIGDGPVRGEILEKARALGIGDRVRFTGMVPIAEVPEYLSALDMAVIPSAARHASPMKLMEYMGAGLPMVVPDLPSIRAVLGGGDAGNTGGPDGAEGADRSDQGAQMGAIFPAGDWEAMRLSLLRLLKDPAAARALGDRARKHALAELTWVRHGRAVLDRLAEKPAARARPRSTPAPDPVP